MQNVNPIALGEVRLVLAELFYVAVGLGTGRGSRISRRDMMWVLLLGVVGYGGTSGFQMYGTYLTSAHFAALVLSLTPLLLLVSMRLLLRVPVSKIAIWMSAASVVGLVVSIRPWATIRSANPMGVLALMVACVSWVLYSTYIQRFMVRYNPWAVMKYSTIGGIVVLLPFAWPKLHTAYALLRSVDSVALIIYVAVCSTGVAYLCWNMSIKVVGPELPALFYFFQPLVATLLGVTVVHERLTLAFVVGAIEMIACVSFGVYFQGQYARPKRRQSECVSADG